jgi:large subunit ribosomal protein L22
MRTVATARFVRVSARKARLVLDQIRGRSVGEALATLQYTPRAAARLVEKVLRSAVANAEHNHQVRDLDALRVHHAIADGGPSLKRVQPRAMGRAFFIKHRTSHLSIGVSDEVNGTQPPAPPRHMRRAQRASGPQSTAPERTETEKRPTRTRAKAPAARARKPRKESK